MQLLHEVMRMDRLQQQIAFLVEIDKLKTIIRQSFLTDGSRRENDAEHSWHLAIMALILSEHSNCPNLDILKVVKMLIIHDLVEIDAGDTFAYDEKGYEDKELREREAAKRIFGMLPTDQGNEYYDLWLEFEKRESTESKFANVIDRLQPILQNYYSKGKSWRTHSIHKEQVLKRVEFFKECSEPLWDFVERLINDAAEKNFLLS